METYIIFSLEIFLKKLPNLLSVSFYIVSYRALAFTSGSLLWINE